MACPFRDCEYIHQYIFAITNPAAFLKVVNRFPWPGHRDDVMGDGNANEGDSGEFEEMRWSV
jgi:hypothetical protein